MGTYSDYEKYFENNYINTNPMMNDIHLKPVISSMLYIIEV